MGISFLEEQAARCRSLANAADESTKRRLLDLAARYDARQSPSSLPSRLLKVRVNLPDQLSEHL
jgi:hypothetical protein